MHEILFFNGQDAINLNSASQTNLYTSFQCPALKSEQHVDLKRLLGLNSFKLENGINHSCLKNPRT